MQLLIKLSVDDDDDEKKQLSLELSTNQTSKQTKNPLVELVS